MDTDRLLGRDTVGTGDPAALTVSGGLEFSGSGGIRRSALTGDVTASAGNNATTIANNAVTTAKINDKAVTEAKLAADAASKSTILAIGSIQTVSGNTGAMSMDLGGVGANHAFLPMPKAGKATHISLMLSSGVIIASGSISVGVSVSGGRCRGFRELV